MLRRAAPRVNLSANPVRLALQRLDAIERRAGVAIEAVGASTEAALAGSDPTRAQPCIVRTGTGWVVAYLEETQAGTWDVFARRYGCP